MKSPKSSLWQVMVMLVMIICLLGIVFVQAQEEKIRPAPEVIIKEWKQIHEVQWQPQPHPYFHYHDYYYIDPSGKSFVEIVGHTTMCPRAGGESVWFVYRTKDRELKFLKFDPVRKIWGDPKDFISDPKAMQLWIQTWHADFDAALKAYNETEDCDKDCG